MPLICLLVCSLLEMYFNTISGTQRLATLLEGVNNKFFEVNFKNLIFYIYGCSRVSKLEIVMLHDSVVKGQSVIMFLY